MSRLQLLQTESRKAAKSEERATDGAHFSAAVLSAVSSESTGSSESSQALTAEGESCRSTSSHI